LNCCHFLIFGLSGLKATFIVLKPDHFRTRSALPLSLLYCSLIARLLQVPEADQTSNLSVRSSANQLTKTASNISIHGNPDNVFKNKTLLTFAVVGLLYGGIHASSWNGHFPSLVEQTMWRVSVCIVGGGGFIISSGWILSKPSVEGWSGGIATIFMYSYLIWFGILVLGFFVSRIYLVVEAFISIRSLPLGVYSTVNWVVFSPHIG
jgi:hypothetical protein